MATITFGAIELFKKHKIDFVNKNDRDRLYLVVIKIQNMLKKRFHVDDYSINLNKLTSIKIAKIFKKKNEHRELHSNILALFGIENILDDEQENKDIKRVKSDSLFFDPALMYEWYVYDFINSDYCKTYDTFGVLPGEVYFKDKGKYKKYFIKVNNSTIEKNSEPDIIIVYQDKKIVIDVKWKNLDKFEDISDSDILKRKRDKEIYEACDSFLVFQNLNPLSNDKLFDKIYFDFKVVRIPYPK